MIRIKKPIRLKYFYKIVLLTIGLSLVLFIFFNNRDISQRPQSKNTSTKIYDKQILQNITSLNVNNNLYNEHKFAQLDDKNLIIVVQVHLRLNYLEKLIDSLSKVKGINETLIIFSHDIYDENINMLIKSIKFSKVAQIFFPFSQQIWKKTFPGTSVDDCLRDLKKSDALQSNCSNANYPDTYGHYREAHVTQTKHHWWWKLNYVFDHLSHSNQHNGDFVFVEEDHYFSPDFVHIWKLMKQAQKELEKEELLVDILTLGNYDKNYNVKINANKLILTEWFSGKHNMAFTVDRALWNKIKFCATEFCTYDDYNWDWSLQHLNSLCFDSKLLTLVPIVPRVYHIGKCGLHHKGTQCDTNSQIEMLENSFHKWFRKQFFPNNLTVSKKNIVVKALKNNGGWSDPRDHQLCTQYELPFLQIISSNINFINVKDEIIEKLM